MITNRFALAGVVTIVFGLVACGTQGATPPEAPVPEAPVPEASVPEAPAPETSAPAESYVVAASADQVLGTWHKGRVHMRFDADGKLAYAESVDGLQSAPFAINSYEFKGEALEIVEVRVSGVPGCGAAVGKYELRLLEDGNLQIVTVSEDCPQRGVETAGIYEPVK